MTDRAIELYRQAIQLAPDEPQYREYLGEYYHTLGRRKDAVATWRGMAEGKNRTTRNLVRLAEVLGRFGYRKEALQAMSEACRMEPELADRLRFAEMLRDSEQYDEAVEQLRLAESQATTPEERQRVIEESVRCYKASGQLDDRIQALRRELESARQPTAAQWRRLALFLDAARQKDEAVKAIRRALQLEPSSVQTLSVAARLFESAGQLSDAVQACRTLAKVDRRFRAEYLQQVALLELRLGRTDAALQAGRELLEAAPGNLDYASFYAELCFRLGRTDEGLRVLRRCVRLNPSDPDALVALAQALAENFRTDEAIELYWRALQRTDDLQQRLALISPLAQLHLRIDQFERLLQRLQTLGRERGQAREAAFCTAAAYEAADDFGSARRTLESLLTEDTRDVQLLRRLVALAEREDDLETAVRYQRRVNELAPSKEGLRRLASLLSELGESDEAERIWTQLVAEERQPDTFFLAVDDLLRHRYYEQADRLLARWLRDHPKDWEALFRRGVALWKLHDKDRAARCFEQLSELDLSEDEPSIRKKRLVGKTASSSPSRRFSWPSQYPPVFSRSSAASQVLELLRPRSLFYSSSPFWSWQPDDYGQARVAAVSALYLAAVERGEADAFVSRFRQRATSPNATVQERKDWLYLQWFLDLQQTAAQRGRATYEAALLLSQAELTAETAVLYLRELRNRVPRSLEGAGGQAEPLPEPELEHMLRCYELLRAQRPEWLTSTGWYLPTVVAGELIRAGKKEKADALYRRVVADAERSPDWLGPALRLAAQRGDTRALLQLLQRLTHGDQLPRWLPAYADPVARTMAYCVLTGRLDDVLALLDRAFDVALAWQQRVPRRARVPASTTYVTYLRVYTTPPRWVELSYPRPRLYLDHSQISVLRNAYAFFKEKRQLDRLLDHLKRRAETGDAASRVAAALARAAVYWWEQQKALAAEAAEEALAAAPDDFDLRLQVAEEVEQAGESERALQLLDQAEPLDRRTLLRREALALRLAVRMGNVERARKAAERLFGLRLPVQTQVQLAAQMEQLGLHELAEAVRRRARRRAGNRTSALVGLLQQYLRQGRSEVAVEIAHEILRRVPPQPQTPYWYGQPARTARRLALTVLARSGRLNDLIRRAEQQLQRSPKSVVLHERLAEYYEAAGQKERSLEVLKKAAALHPKDAELQYRVASKLYSAGQFKDAADFYLAAFRSEPSLFARDYYRVDDIFRQADRMDDLLAWLNQVDLRRLGQPYVLSNVIRGLLRRKETFELGVQLLKRAWQAFPDAGYNLIGSLLYNDEVWQLPEVYEFAHKALLPRPGHPLRSPWAGMDYVLYNVNGRAVGVVTRVLQAAESQGKLASFAQEVRDALKRCPQWTGGEALLAVVEAKLGQVDSARKTMQRLLNDQKHPMPFYARLLVGQELKEVDELRDVALHCFQVSPADLQTERTQYRFSPLQQLIRLYAKLGRRDRARQLLLEVLERSQQNYYGSSPDYEAYRQLEDMRAVAGDLLLLGFPVDAFRVYHAALSDEERIERAKPVGVDYLLQELEKGRKRAEAELSAEALRDALFRWVPDHVDSPSGSSHRPAVDLVLTANTKPLRAARINSLFQHAVELAAERGSSGKLFAELRQRLTRLHEQRPDDLSVVVADALLALVGGDVSQRRGALQRVVEWVDAHPLEPLPAGQRPSPRQRAQALQQVAVWLVAREAWKDESTRATAERLTERALQAARRQTNPAWTLAILHKLGQQALDDGDRAAAEKYWSELLDAVLSRSGSD